MTVPAPKPAPGVDVLLIDVTYSSDIAQCLFYAPVS